MSVPLIPIRVMLTPSAATPTVPTAVSVNKGSLEMAPFAMVYMQFQYHRISSNKRPPPRPKYQASFPLPSPITFLNTVVRIQRKPVSFAFAFITFKALTVQH